jgi:hypothetical protein
MSRILQLRRGTSIELDAITGAEGEIFVDLTNNTLRIHNSVIQGGTSLASETYVNNEVSTAIADLASETYVDNAIAAIEVDFSMIMEDIIPAISGVYDIGTPDHQWYNGYFANKVDINGIEFTNIGDNDLQITAETIITDSDLLAKSLLLDDIFITGNIIKPLSTPLYGQREVIVDGGLHVASEDAAYIRLTQEIPVTEKAVSQRFSNVEDGYAYDWQNNYYDSFEFLLDVSQLAPGFPQEMWVYNLPGNDEYTQILAGQLVPGLKYKIEVERIANGEYPLYPTNRTVLESYLFEDVEYVGSEVFAGSLYLKFKSPVPGSSAIIGLYYDYPGFDSNPAGLDFVISAESTTIEYDYSVLDTYGSEGMIRFNPEIKKFEGHDGTKWDSVTAVDPATVYVKNASLSVTTSLTVNESDAGAFNNFFGYQAGNSNTTGRFNNFFGYYAGRFSTTGCNNNFFGYLAGRYNTSGSDNNFFGCYAGRFNTTGCNNNFFGRAAGRYNTTGSYNNFFGESAGGYNSTGSYNNFFGYYAGRNNISGYDNNFFGRSAGYCNTTGSNNNFFGYLAGRVNTTGSSNNFFGYLAGRNNTTGCFNNFFGESAGGYNTSGCNNNFFGRGAGRFSTTGCNNNFFGCYAGHSNSTGSYNNFFGHLAGRNNISGRYNNFFGRSAGRCNTTGCNNNFFGRYAGYFNTTGCNNNFFGCSAGLCNTTGSLNNFFGFYAGRCNSTGCNNNFFGREVGSCSTTGFDNNFFGRYAGRLNITGSFNNFFGHYAGHSNTSGCNNILIGCRTGQNATCGLACITTESNRIILGNCAHTCAQIQVAWTVVSDERDKCIFGSVPHGRGFLQKINPVKFAFKDRTTGCLTDPEGKLRYGFSAQNLLVQEGDDPVIVSTENQDKLQVTSDYLIPVLVNAINELSREVDNIINENKTLKDRILNLEQK